VHAILPHTADRFRPHQLPTRRERRIIGVRVTRRWGPARIGYLLGITTPRRFVIGMLIYAFYGYKHSKLGHGEVVHTENG
jgi:hypothetical protein